MDNKLLRALLPFTFVSMFMMVAVMLDKANNSNIFVIGWSIFYFGAMIIRLLYVYEGWPFRKR